MEVSQSKVQQELNDYKRNPQEKKPTAGEMRATRVTSQNGPSNSLSINCVITGLTFFHQIIKEKKKTSND